MCSEKTGDQRRTERYHFEADIEFSSNADVLSASCVDVSQTGISFNTKTPFELNMCLKIDGKTENRRARIVWACSLPDGCLRLGLDFVDEESPPQDTA